MKYLVLIFFVVVNLNFQDKEAMLLGRWKLQHNDTFDRILESPGFQAIPLEQQLITKKQFVTILEETCYHFSQDSVVYTDMQGLDLVTRRASWSLSGDTILFHDASRQYENQALINRVTTDSLIIHLIIEGVASDSRLIFTREKVK